MRKKILFIMCFSFLSLLPLVKSQCITPTGDLIEIYDDNSEIILCTGTYYLGNPDWQIGVYIEANNVVFDCNGSTLINPLDGEIIGIFSDSCNNLTIKNCILRNYGWQILPSSCNNVTIHDNEILNTVNNYGEASGILCDYTDNMHVYDNIITNITSTSPGEIDLQGIWIDTCEGAVIENNEISGSQERGLRIEKVMGTETRGNYIHDNRLGVYMVGVGTTVWVTLDSQNDIIIDNENDFHLMELANVTVLNTTYDTVVFNATGITMPFRSCGQQTEPGAVCYVERQWYMDVNAQEQSVSSLENVNVLIKDVFNTELFNGLTASNGKIPRQIITQYIQDFTGTTSYTPHTISLSKTGYVAKDEVVTVNSNKFLTLTLESEVVDTDGDGLTDDEETDGWSVTRYSCAGIPIQVAHVTSDPNIADEDGDGLNDYEEREGWHVSYAWNAMRIEYDVSSHPQYADIDRDGANDLQERTAGTDPNRDDTDCDKAWNTTDGFEIDYGMDPLNSDTDDDGITDGEEIDMWIEEAGYDPSQPEEIPPEVIEEAVVNTIDEDADDDGVNDGEDNCPNNYNPDQLDFDLDEKGDVCDICPYDTDNDMDGDGVCGNVDNCPIVYNPDQLDIDGDNIGDACDTCIDVDGDGYGTGEGCLGTDCDDNNPAVHPGATEVCNGIDDNCNGEVDDVDEDNDGVNDCVNDKCLNTIPWFAGTELKPNHYDSLNIDLTATYGCSCEQILYCKPGQNNGEYKFGCSQGTIDVWMTQDPESWALDCQTDGVVAMEGADKSLFTDTDGDWWIDGLDGDSDNDGLTNNDDDMTDDADLPGTPGHGTPDWYKKK